METKDGKDLFISHAREDKAFVRQLVEALRERKVTVWYDEFELRVGDSLRRNIEHGLATSRFGVVVLSHSFLQKEWPQRELDGLVALETTDGRRRVLPVWHGVTDSDVVSRFPMLAGIFALQSSDGVAKVADRLREAIDLQGVAPERYYGTVHVDTEIDVVALARSSGYRLTDQYFKNCRLLGPAVLGVGDTNTFSDMTFPLSSVWQIDSNRPYVGLILLERSRLEACQLEWIGFAGDREFLERIAYLPRAEPPNSAL